MRILLHDYSGHPFQVQLSRELARRGHTVLHAHCSSFTTGKGQLERQADDPDGFTTTGVSLGRPFEKYDLPKRSVQELAYGRRFVEQVGWFRPDVLISSNTPLLSQQVIQPWARRHGVRFVFWQQDVYSIGMRPAIEARVPVVGSLIADGFVALEQRLLRRSDAVVVISEDFTPILDEWGVERARTTVIENWAPVDELPVVDRRNRWAAEHGLVDATVLLYSGTLGLKHNPGLLLHLARSFADRPEVRVVVVSEGLGADWLAREKAAQGVDNLVLLPFQPFARLPEVMASGDVLLAILEPEAGVFSVPSKVLSYHCARRPLVASVPAENLAARIIEREGSGIVVDPGDEAGFAAAARRLVEDPDLRGRMGDAARRYAEDAFDIARIGDRFEAVVAPLVTV